MVLIECCSRELLSNLENMTCKINAITCHISGIYLIAKDFLSLTSYDTYHWLKQTELMLFPTPSFLNFYFWRKIWNCAFCGEYKCIFKVWMLLSRINLHLGWQTSQVHKGALATWSFMEEYILKLLSWPSSNLETSTFLTFSQPERTKFSCAESVFSGLNPKLCCSRGLRTAYVVHNKLCSTI